MSRGTPTTPFRIPADVKLPAAEKAKRRGETLTDVVIRALREYALAPDDPVSGKE